MVRLPAVAGMFYPSNPIDLRNAIKDCFNHELGPKKNPPAVENFGKIVSIISPHAGYLYSGPIAAHGFYACSALKKIDLAVIIGPNHYGIGSGIATVIEDSWRTPLGEVKVDIEAVKKLLDISDLIDIDEKSHKREHSIEVQIPFLQYIFGDDFKILPLSMLIQDMTTSIEVGKAIAKCIDGVNSLIIASSDFTHYENQEIARKKDTEAIGSILDMNIPNFYNAIEKFDYSLCGYGPITAVLTATKILNASNVKLLKYATSGDITKNYDEVVGYASILSTK